MNMIWHQTKSIEFSFFFQKVHVKSSQNKLETGPFGKKTELYAFCLMPDHVHIQLSPMEANLVDLGQPNGKVSRQIFLRRDGLVRTVLGRGDFMIHEKRKEEDIRGATSAFVNDPDYVLALLKIGLIIRFHGTDGFRVGFNCKVGTVACSTLNKY